ncbi:MAG: hypothetical protein FWE33_05665 [Defluviitaleaceae bacterium]|nr:hypothetical protein [Defluviitaleaceae bacterium]
MNIIEAGIYHRKGFEDMNKHMFAGASTPDGFINFFNYIMPLEKAKKRLFLKGSSGSGKSTFINKIADEFEAIGANTERFHCANDPDSLDALSVAGKGLCILDATAPHCCEPEIPAAIDKIIDFAEFLDEQKVSRYVDEIKSLVRMKKYFIDKAFAYLSAAGSVYLAENEAYNMTLNKNPLNDLLQELLKISNMQRASNSFGFDRKLFISAITPNGFVSLSEGYFGDCKVYGLYGENRAKASIFLTELRDKINAVGINTESFCCPFAPKWIECLHLPDMKIAFAAMDGNFGYKGSVDDKIDVGSCFDTKVLGDIKHKERRNNEYDLFGKMLGAVIESMNLSKVYHTKIEDIYSSAMNFDKVRILTEKTADELLSL